MVLRVFRRDPALHRVAARLHLVLRRNVQRRFVQLVPLRNQNLALHQIDAGHDFRHRVLDLDAGIHFDEEKFAAVHIQQKLHRSRVT